MWEIDFAKQILTFLMSIILGGIFCLIYDLFHLPVRRVGASAVAVFAVDIFYFIFIAVINFCFLLVRCNGEVRGYVLFGEIMGFYICKKTLSPIFCLMISLIIKPIKLLKNLIVRLLSPVFNMFSGFFSKIYEKIGENIKKILKKA